MAILIGLIPALAWGILPIVASKMGGKPSNQILGTTTGTFIIAFLTLIYIRPEITMQTFVLSLLSGIFWAIGQVGQYSAYVSIGVSKTMPISSGLQLIGTTLIGVLAFSEWAGLNTKLLGFAALILVIFGIYLTSLDKSKNSQTSVDKKTFLLLFFTNFGFLAYNSIPDVVATKGVVIFFPQALGMLVGAIGYLLFSKQTAALKEAASWKNIASGVVFSVAALSYILSAQLNGIATGFVLAQLSVVIATLGGIFILKEKKDQAELIATIAGLTIIVVGEIIVAFL